MIELLSCGGRRRVSDAFHQTKEAQASILLLISELLDLRDKVGRIFLHLLVGNLQPVTPLLLICELFP